LEIYLHSGTISLQGFVEIVRITDTEFADMINYI